MFWWICSQDCSKKTKSQDRKDMIENLPLNSIYNDPDVFNCFMNYPLYFDQDSFKKFSQRSLPIEIDWVQ